MLHFTARHAIHIVGNIVGAHDLTCASLVPGKSVRIPMPGLTMRGQNFKAPPAEVPEDVLFDVMQKMRRPVSPRPVPLAQTIRVSLLRQPPLFNARGQSTGHAIAAVQEQF